MYSQELQRRSAADLGPDELGDEAWRSRIKISRWSSGRPLWQLRDCPAVSENACFADLVVSAYTFNIQQVSDKSAFGELRSTPLQPPYGKGAVLTGDRSEYVLYIRAC